MVGLAIGFSETLALENNKTQYKPFPRIYSETPIYIIHLNPGAAVMQGSISRALDL